MEEAAGKEGSMASGEPGARWRRLVTPRALCSEKDSRGTGDQGRVLEGKWRLSEPGEMLSSGRTHQRHRPGQGSIEQGLSPAGPP